MNSPHSTRSGAALALLLIVLVVAGALALAACGRTSKAATTTTSASSAVAASPGQEATPAPAPSGPGSIAFIKKVGRAYADEASDIYVAGSDGTWLGRLTADARGPAWSPDGSRIAFIRDGVANEDGSRKTTICVMNAEGRDEKRVMTTAATVGWLAWSPDGRQIVFSSDETIDRGHGGPDNTALVVVNADGSGLRRVTAPAENVELPGCLAWAPDGRILFIRERLESHVEQIAITTRTGPARHNQVTVQDRFLDICSVRPDGSGLTLIARDYPSFSLSRDGRWLLIGGWSDRLVRLAADGRGKKVVVLDKMPRRTDRFPWACSWSWDGKKIALAADEADVYCDPSPLYVLNADGSGLRRVPHTGKVYNPVWLPQ